MRPNQTTDRRHSLLGLPLPSPGTRFIAALGGLYLLLGAALAWNSVQGLLGGADAGTGGPLALGAMGGLLLAMGVRVIAYRRKIVGEAAHRRGLSAMRAERFSECREHFTRAASAGSNHWEPHYHLGLLASKENRPASEVLAHFEAGLALAPDEPTLMFAIASIEDDLGRRDQAEASLHSLLANHPDHPDAHCLLGCLQEQAGNPERAAVHYRHALEANPDHATALQNVARLAQVGSPPALEDAAGMRS